MPAMVARWRSRRAARMVPGRNTTIFQFIRPTEKDASGSRNCRRKRGCARDGARGHRGPGIFTHRQNTIGDTGVSFRLQHASARWADWFPVLAQRGTASCACFRTPVNIIRSRKWCDNIPHSRGTGNARGRKRSGDVPHSPGWSESPLFKGAHITLTATAEMGWREGRIARD